MRIFKQVLSIVVMVVVLLSLLAFAPLYQRYSQFDSIRVQHYLRVEDEADFNGDIDVDGTANLDAVDIDDAVDLASTLDVAGAATFSGDFILDRQDETVTATWVITPTSANIVMTSDAEYTSSTTTAVITTTAAEGQVIVLRNGNASDALNLDGTGGTVECKANIAIGAKDIVTLIYDATDEVWYCQSVQDNS